MHIVKLRHRKIAYVHGIARNVLLSTIVLGTSSGGQWTAAISILFLVVLVTHDNFILDLVLSFSRLAVSNSATILKTGCKPCSPLASDTR